MYTASLKDIFASDKVDAAFSRLCKQRKDFPANADIWQLRFHWPCEKQRLLQAIHDNAFYFNPLQRITKANGEVIHLWSSIDSLVLKLLAETLSSVLPKFTCCPLLKGHVGAKQTVAAIYKQCQTHEYVFRTDVKSYLDYAMAKKTVFYRRYMDDIIVLAKSRWQLKRAIATINQHFKRLKLKQHPYKTFVGKVKKGVDFLGYQFGSKTLSVAKRTLLNHLRRLSRLYEQKKGHPQWTALLDDYRRRWVSWVYSGIPSSFFNGSYSKRGLYCACLTQAFPTQK